MTPLRRLIWLALIVTTWETQLAYMAAETTAYIAERMLEEEASLRRGWNIP